MKSKYLASIEPYELGFAFACMFLKTEICRCACILRESQLHDIMATPEKHTFGIDGPGTAHMTAAILVIVQPIFQNQIKIKIKNIYLDTPPLIEDIHLKKCYKDISS